MKALAPTLLTLAVDSRFNKHKPYALGRCFGLGLGFLALHFGSSYTILHEPMVSWLSLSYMMSIKEGPKREAVYEFTHTTGFH